MFCVVTHTKCLNIKLFLNIKMDIFHFNFCVIFGELYPEEQTVCFVLFNSIPFSLILCTSSSPVRKISYLSIPSHFILYCSKCLMRLVMVMVMVMIIIIIILFACRLNWHVNRLFKFLMDY